MVCGFVLAVGLELQHPNFVPWAFGLTSGAIALVVNLAIYVAAAYLFPASASERNRLNEIFMLVDESNPLPSGAIAKPITA